MAFPNKDWKNYIPDGVINQAIASWQSKQPDRDQDCATPSTLTMCPRAVWLRYNKKVPVTNVMGWGKKQRNLLGRITENLIAQQLRDEGILLHHWKDDTAGESVKFEHGKGLDRLCGTPDLLIKLGDKVAVSDSKTSRGDAFAYVPTTAEMVWTDPLWNKNRIQGNAYYMLCHWNKEWFESVEANIAANNLKWGMPLPELVHLFSYALDDGIVRREFSWKCSKEDAEEVVRYTRRWNKAYASDTIPKCLCQKEDGVKFCMYGQKFETTKSGYKLATECCGEDLNPDGE